MHLAKLDLKGVQKPTIGIVIGGGAHLRVLKPVFVNLVQQKTQIFK